MINLININKSYKVGNGQITIFSQYNLKIKDGEKVLISGSSGSGKSTLLNIMSTIDTCDNGDIMYGDINIAKCTKKTASDLRLNNFGFIFQSYHLIKTLNVYDNILLPIIASGKKIDNKYIDELIGKLGITERLNHFPYQLSGGEQQRVAIARAMVNKPDIIFADEPTGNLDYKNSKYVMEVLIDLCENQGTTLIMVTHDLSLSKYFDKVISIDKEKEA